MAHFRMFIDDTRDVDNEATNDPRRRFASITGVIFDMSYYDKSFEPHFYSFRERHFGLTNKGRPPILRRHNIMKRQGPFQSLNDENKERLWLENCRALYGKAEYRVITCSIDKIAFYYKNPTWRGDIYSLLVQTAVERYFFFLQADRSTGDVLAEQRGKRDVRLKQHFRSMMDNGNGYISARDLNKHLSSREIKIKPESDDIAGLQMADLLAATSFSHCCHLAGLGRAPSGFSGEVARLLEADKYHRDSKGDPSRFGRVWRPK